jgi:hypothetical protein
MTNHDWDFLAGEWTCVNRRRTHILAGSDEWYEFPATASCTLQLDGNSTFDVLRAPERDIEGITLRLFDAGKQVWRIWWATARSGDLDEPVVGTFVDGNGTFECDDTWEGKPVRVRYQWLDTAAADPRWEQSFSPDGGLTWEVNWTATFRRSQQATA